MGNYLKFRPDGTAVGLLALLVAVVLAFSLLMPGALLQRRHLHQRGVPAAGAGPADPWQCSSRSSAAA